jgi:hypothetical protein
MDLHVRIDEAVDIFARKGRGAIVTPGAWHAPLGTTAGTAPPCLLDEPAPTCGTCPSGKRTPGEMESIR